MPAGVDAFAAALGQRIRPRGPGLADLFTDDGVTEVPFDGDGGTSSIGDASPTSDASGAAASQSSRCATG